MKSREQTRARWLVACITATAVWVASGCSMIAGKTGTPSPHFPCNPSGTAATLDIVGTGYFILNTAVIAGADDSTLRDGGIDPSNRGMAVGISAGFGALTAYSAMKGREYVRRCEQRIARDVRNQTRTISEAYWNESSEPTIISIKEKQ